MKVPYGAVDADGHINEPETKLMEYLEGPYADIKNFHSYIPGSDGIVGGSVVAGKDYMDSTLGGRLGAHGGPDFPTPQEWLDNADAGGLETIFVFPTTLLGYSRIIDPDYLVALTKSYNNYVSEEWLKFSPRFKSVALMPLMDVDESIKEMRRCVTELGYNGVFIAAVGFGLLGEKRLDPFYEEAEKLGTFIAVHGGHATGESPEIHQIHPAPHHRLPRFRHDADDAHDLRGRLRKIPQPQSRIPGSRMHLGTLPPRPDGRGMGEARLVRDPQLQEEAERLHQGRQRLHPRRAGRGVDPRSHPRHGPEPAVLRLPTGPTGTTNTPKASTTSTTAKTSPKPTNAPSSATTPPKCTASPTPPNPHPNRHSPIPPPHSRHPLRHSRHPLRHSRHPLRHSRHPPPSFPRRREDGFTFQVQRLR